MELNAILGGRRLWPRQNLCTLNFSAAFTKTASECNTIVEKCQDNVKATVKRIKNQIQKGTNPEKAARHGYEKTCDYLDIQEEVENLLRLHLSAIPSWKNARIMSRLLSKELKTKFKRVPIL